MRSRADLFGSVAIGLAALVIAGSVVFRTLFPRTSMQPSATTPELITYWADAVQAALPLGGDPGAPVTLLALVDFECPACRTFHHTVARALNNNNTLRAFYVHYPLNYHRFALPAARAAECAESVGAFGRLVDVIYAKQDSLGLKGWGSYAMEAGIADTTHIAKCAAERATYPRIDAGIEFGNRLVF